MLYIRQEKDFSQFNYILVAGGWGNWRSVSVDHCINEPDAEVKQIRYCDNPLPKYGGDLCPDPDYNERQILCNETNYQGMQRKCVTYSQYYLILNGAITYLGKITFKFCYQNLE